MKTTIYYFTGTGNSLAIAKSLLKGLDNAEINSIAKSLREENFYNISGITGFVFPNYYSKIPGLVSRFLKKVDLKNADYIFGIVTGGGSSGYTLNELRRILKSRGKKLNSFCEILLPGNYIIAPYYTVTNRTDKAKKVLYNNADKKIADLAGKIKNREIFFEKGNTPIKIITRLFNIPNILSKTEIWDKNFIVEESCNSCKTCEKICPVGNIKLINGIPEWQHNCQVCMSCIHNCPKEAIQYKNQTKNKARYRHPEVGLKELISKY